MFVLLYLYQYDFTLTRICFISLHSLIYIVHIQYTVQELCCNVLLCFLIRFEIEKKLRQQKKKEQRKKEKGTVSSVQELKDLKSASQRSMERRKNMEEKKDNKKFSALTDLMKKREEKKKIGLLIYCFHMFQL